MAWKANLTGSGQAASAADLTAATNQYRAVKLTNNGTEFTLAGVGEAMFGILQNKPGIGHAGNIATDGQSKARAGGTIPAGADVAVGANGLFVVASGARVKTDDAGVAADALIGPNVVGQAINSAVVGDVFTLDIQRRGAIPATVAA
jgi:hypothetical protein